MSRKNNTPEDDLNALNIANAVCWHLVEVFGVPFRCLWSPTDTEPHDFELELFNGECWVYFGRLETKAREYHQPPKVSESKVDKIRDSCEKNNGWPILAFWFDDTPEYIHIADLRKPWANGSWISHSKREGNGDPAYVFPRCEMTAVPIFAKRLTSPNSKR